MSRPQIKITLIGVDRMRFRFPVRFTEAEGSCILNGVVINFDQKTGKSN